MEEKYIEYTDALAKLTNKYRAEFGDNIEGVLYNYITNVKYVRDNSFKYKIEDRYSIYNENNNEDYEVVNEYFGDIEISSTIGIFRDENQDAYSHDYLEDLRMTIIGVYDGHMDNGKLASEYVRDNLPKTIIEMIESSRRLVDQSETPTLLDKDYYVYDLDEYKIQNILINAFYEVDKQMRKESKFDKGGTTACVCVIYEQFIITANLGDTEAVVVDEHNVNRLSTIHIIKENESEKIRINNIVDSFFKDGRKIITLENDLGTEITRSLGDNTQNQISRVPDTSIYVSRGIHNEKLYIFSDGVSDSIPYSLLKTFNDKNSEEIVREAIRLGSKDNVTCIVVDLDKMEKNGNFMKFDGGRHNEIMNQRAINAMFNLFPEKFM